MASTVQWSRQTIRLQRSVYSVQLSIIELKLKSAVESMNTSKICKCLRTKWLSKIIWVIMLCTLLFDLKSHQLLIWSSELASVILIIATSLVKHQRKHHIMEFFCRKPKNCLDSSILQVKGLVSQTTSLWPPQNAAKSCLTSLIASSSKTIRSIRIHRTQRIASLSLSSFTTRFWTRKPKQWVC